MNKFLKKISAVVQLVLLAPVKLPGKALNVIKYVALGLGILEAVMSDKSDRVTSDEEEGEPVPNSLRDDEGGKVDKDKLGEGEP